MHVVAIIPCRGGSKGLPDKNLQKVGGVPLVVRAINMLQQINIAGVDLDIVVTTDSPKIAAVADEAGALVLMQPPKVSTDESRLEDAVLWALTALEDQRIGTYDITVMVQCTSPFTLPTDVVTGIKMVQRGPSTCAFAAAPFQHHIWEYNDDVELVPVNHGGNKRELRQHSATQYIECGSFYVVKTTEFVEAGFRFFGTTKAVVVSNPNLRFEIDTPDDLWFANLIAGQQAPALLRKGDKLYVDMDETLCVTPDDRDYTKAVPIQSMIDYVNHIRDKTGCQMVIWTARGAETGINWFDVTKQQLDKWKVDYDEISLEKPAFAMLIDDKASPFPQTMSGG